MRGWRNLIIGLIAIGGMLGAAHAAPAASDFTVKDISDECASKNPSEELMCWNYFMGLMNGLEAASSLYGAEVPICYPPSGLSIGDMILAFRLWASTHPEASQDGATYRIITSLVERFPCPNKS